MMRSLSRGLCFAAAASPAVVALWTILRYGVDVPTMDQWEPDVAGIFVKAHRGTLVLGDFLAQHNEHRMVVPRILMFALGLLTRWNTVAEMVLAWAIACVTSAGVLALGLRTAQDRRFEAAPSERVPASRLVPWFLANLLIFSPAQWNNWLWGMGIANVLPPACVVLAVLAVVSRRRFAIGVVLGLVLATAATFSTAFGALAWPVLGVLLAGSDRFRDRRIRLGVLLAWFAGLLVNAALYLRHYAEPPHRAGFQAYFPSVGASMHYAFAFLGNAFAPSGGVAPVAIAVCSGTAMVASLGVCAALRASLRRRGRAPGIPERTLPWIAISIFALGGSAVAAIFRGGFGAEQAIESRYLATSILLPIALIHLLPMVCVAACAAWRERRPATTRFLDRLPAALAAAVILLALLDLPASLRACANDERTRLQAKAQLLLVDVLRDDSRLKRDLCFHPSRMIETAHALNEMGYLRPPLIAERRASRVRRASERPAGDPVGTLERCVESKSGELSVVGWARSPLRAAPADAVVLTCDDENGEPVFLAWADMGIERPDVAKAKGAAGLLGTGWVADFRAPPLPPGSRNLRVRGWALVTKTASVFPLEGEAVFPADR
jgi:hypothetical protein